jgi:hypothetical protein
MSLSEELWWVNNWIQLVGFVLHVQLDDQDDSFMWCPGKRVLSTQSMYKDSMKVEGTPIYRYITWKVKLSLKIKIFL